MYAYVEYEDGVPAIVSTALIKNFKPKSLSDIDCTLRKTYWKSGSGKNAIGNYYNARVKMLGETKSQLITTMAAARISIPEIIDFSNEGNEKTEVGVQEQDPYKEVGWRNPKKRKMTEKESSVQKDSNRQTKGKKPKRRRQEVEETDESDCDVDDDVVPRQSLVEEQKKVRDLKSKISKLRNELDEERKLVRRLQLTLLTKIDVLSDQARLTREYEPSAVSSRGKSGECSTSLAFNKGMGLETLSGNEGPHVAPQTTPVAHLATPLTQVSGSTEAESTEAPIFDAVGDQSTSEPALITATVDSGQSLEGNEEAPLHAVLGNQVHLGSNVYIESAKLQFLMDLPDDSHFCKGVVRALWTADELLGRSVTGQPCRRFAKQGASAKRALTPKKLAAVKSAFDAYIERHPSAVSDPRLRAKEEEARRKRLNAHVGSLLCEKNRSRRLAYCTPE